jgi:hypothetical protein
LKKNRSGSLILFLFLSLSRPKPIIAHKKYTFYESARQTLQKNTDILQFSVIFMFFWTMQWTGKMVNQIWSFIVEFDELIYKIKVKNRQSAIIIQP